MASITVARVRGIPIRLHATFLLLLPVFAYLMAIAYFRPAPGVAPDNFGWMWGALLAIGLFGSVLVHELAHSLMALREGVKVRSITLLPIGGVSGFEEIPKDAGKEFRITIVGPLTNFVIGVPLLLVAMPMPPLLPQLPEFLFRLGALNLLIGAFNLFIPAFPMDGGRILRSALSRRMPRAKATRIASLTGQGIAVLFGLLGFLTFGAGGWLLLLIAVFVFMGARGEENATRLTEALEPFQVVDLMTREVETVPPRASVEEALDQMLAGKRLVLPVRNENGGVLGVVDLAALEAVPRDERPAQTVGELTRVEFDRALPQDPATDLGRLLTGGGGPVLVFDAVDRLVGIVTRTDVARFTQIATASGRSGRRMQPGG